MPIHVFNEGLKCHLLEGLEPLLGGPSSYLPVLNGEVLGFISPAGPSASMALLFLLNPSLEMS